VVDAFGLVEPDCDSAKVLSELSPMDSRAPASARRLVYRIEVYWAVGLGVVHEPAEEFVGLGAAHRAISSASSSKAVHRRGGAPAADTTGEHVDHIGSFQLADLTLQLLDPWPRPTT